MDLARTSRPDFGLLARIWSFCARFQQFSEIRYLLSESGHIRWNSATFTEIRPLFLEFGHPDSNESVRISAFISDSGYSSQNPKKVVGILSVSDEISSPVIFILFYINIYMF